MRNKWNRIFPVIVLLLSLFIGASCGEEKIAVRRGSGDNGTTITPNPGMNLVGRVTVDGNPRQGVVVSDGNNVTTTDKDGIYQMHTSKAEWVFVSMPEDCQIETNLSVPVTFKKIGTIGNNAVERDFTLRSKAVDNDFSMLALADVQVGTSNDLELCKPLMDSIANYEHQIGGTVYGISLGDLSWNNPGIYADYKSLVSKIGIPVFSVIGNHDHNEKTMGDSLSDQEYRDAMGPTFYSCNLGKWHLVVLDDVLYSGKNGRNDYTGKITDRQLAWLRKDLSYVDKNKSILVALHIPTSRRNNPNVYLSNRNALYDLVKDFHRTVILSGHTHNNFTTDISSNIREYTLGAVMGAYWNTYKGKGICNDGSPRGFAVLKFKGNELTDEYYKGEETPLSYQIKIYPPSEASFRWGRKEGAITSPDAAVPVRVDNSTVLVNVFNWHTDWTVTISEDGGAAVPLTPNVTCLDPEAVRMLEYENAWEKRPTAEPEKHNDHMFLYTPRSTSWKTLTVNAVDPWGNHYTATLKQ
jgi:hypothetical protein